MKKNKKKYLGLVIIYTATKFPFITGRLRAKLCKLGGINFIDASRCFVGHNVTFDRNHPELITIGPHTIITQGVCILTHFYDTHNPDPNHHKMIINSVKIGKDVFIGMNTIIVNSVRIGDGVIIGANSVITKDIPDYVIVGGNPAKVLRARDISSTH